MTMTERTYKNREPLDPQIRAVFDATLAARETNPRVLDAKVMRSTEAVMEMMFNIGAPEVAVEKQIAIPGPGGDIPATVHAAAGSDLPVILYAHGGGYCVMSPRTHAKVTKELANGAGAVVVSIDYRLAPEHPHPAGIEDCIAAYRWLLGHAGRAGRRRIAHRARRRFRGRRHRRRGGTAARRGGRDAAGRAD